MAPAENGMRPSARKHSVKARSLCVLLIPLALLACGKSDPEPGKKVEMRDMEVVDGTVSDSMTDLDAVRADGTALAGNAADNAAQPSNRSTRRAPRGEVDEAAQDAEAVPAE